MHLGLGGEEHVHDFYRRGATGVWSQVGPGIVAEAIDSHWLLVSLSLSENGTVLAVGNPGEDGVNGTDSGQVYE